AVRVVAAFRRPVREIEHCWIPLRDGCRLAARIWLPADAEVAPVPAILEYLPYRKRDLTRARDEPMHGYFAGHGYAAVRVDVRGSGDSDGVLLDEYHEQELEDGGEVIRWIASQPWCTGGVGRLGQAWGGFRALRIACPVYAIGGWADAYTNAIPRLLSGLRSPRKGLVGPWSHNYPHSGVPGPAIGFLQEARRWWNHWLKGIDTGIMNEPPYRVWMQESVPPRPSYAVRPGRWVAEPSWPSPRLTTRRYALNPGQLGETSAPETPLPWRSPAATGL